jgi:hypothetical protein
VHLVFEGRELLKNANGVRGAENRDRTGEANIFRARGGSGEDYNGCLIEEFRTVKFANADDVQTNTIGVLCRYVKVGFRTLI